MADSKIRCLPGRGNPLDLLGLKFHRLTVISQARNIGRNRAWLCLCDCGNEKIIRASHLTGGKIASCGCLMKETSANINRTHGKSKSPEYRIWAGIKRRCLNPNQETYKKYGARGISISKEWELSFERFILDMGERPSQNHSIERLDNSLGYSKENCKWATGAEQVLNKRNTFLVIIEDGEKITIREAARRRGLNPDTVYSRIHTYGWTVEEALSTPARPCNRTY